ncbi:hypothetical protein M378DRAFT_16050, partial [Amanita muscaria Koide BX008]
CLSQGRPNKYDEPPPSGEVPQPGASTTMPPQGEEPQQVANSPMPVDPPPTKEHPDTLDNDNSRM